MDDMDRADGLFQAGIEAGRENMHSFPRMSSQEIQGHIAELDAEVKRSKEAGETCPNIGEDFDRAIRDLQDARKRIVDLCFTLEILVGGLMCANTTSGKHEWRRSHQWDDPNPPHWCCRCGLEAADVVDVVRSNISRDLRHQRRIP